MFAFQRGAHALLQLSRKQPTAVGNVGVAGSPRSPTKQNLLAISVACLRSGSRGYLPHTFTGSTDTGGGNAQFLLPVPKPLTFPKGPERTPGGRRRARDPEQEATGAGGERRRQKGRGDRGGVTGEELEATCVSLNSAAVSPHRTQQTASTHFNQCLFLPLDPEGSS